MKKLLILSLLFSPLLALAVNITVPQSTAFGDVLRGKANGTYTPVATSTLGIIDRGWEAIFGTTTTGNLNVDGNATTTGNFNVGADANALHIYEKDFGGAYLAQEISGDIYVPSIPLTFADAGVVINNRLIVSYNADDTFGDAIGFGSPNILMLGESGNAWSLEMDVDEFKFVPNSDDMNVTISSYEGSGGNLGVEGYIGAGNNYSAIIGDDGNLFAGNFYNIEGDNVYLAYNDGGSNYAINATGNSYFDGIIETTGAVTVNSDNNYMADLGNETSYYAGYFTDSTYVDTYLGYDPSGAGTGPYYAIYTTGDAYFDGNATTTGSSYVGDGIYMPTNKGLYTGSQLLAFGDTADHSYYFGGAGNLTATGDYNIAIGEGVLANATDGGYNIALGDNAMGSATGADYNVAIGVNALATLTTAGNNTAVGYNAMSNLGSAGNNVAVGYYSQANSVTGDYNTSVGVGSGQYGNGDYNTSLGYFAGNGTNATDNTNNVSLGYFVGTALTTGSENVLIGSGTGSLTSSGSNNILIGYDIEATASSTSNYISIGDLYLGDIDLNVATIDGDLEATGYVTGRPSRKSPISMSTEFMSNNGNTFGEWLGNVYGSGSIGSGGEDNHPGTITLYDSTTAGGGYYINTSAVGIDLSGNESTEFVFEIHKTADTECRWGFQDSFLGATSTDGLYFSMIDESEIRAFACSNSTCTEADTSYTFSNNTWYAGLIETNSDATEATFTLYNSATGVELWSETITSNVPTGSARKVGHSVNCFENTTDSASALMSLDYMNLYFNRNFTR